MDEVSTGELLGALSFFLLVLLVIALGARRWWVGQGHGQAIASFARSRGLTYVPRDDFNARFRGRALDRDLAQEVLPPWTQQALMQQPPLRLRIRGNEAISWKRGRLLPHELDEHLGTIAALVDGIPPTVWIDYRGSA